MRQLGILCATALMTLCASSGLAQTDEALPFTSRWLTPRVLVLTEVSPWECNHVVLVTQKGLVLVDPGSSPVMARLIRQAVARELGRDQFAYVVDTHEHWGHTFGNGSFPEAVVVGHEQAVQAMLADAANVGARVEGFKRRLAEVEARLPTLDPASDEARTGQLQRDHFERIVRGLSEPGFAVRPPDLAFSDRLTVDLGDMTLHFFYLGRGHSGSDTVLLVPEEKVLLMGCFFFMQGPLPTFGGQPALDVDRWLEVLGAVLDGPDPVVHVILGQNQIWTRDQLVVMRDYIADLWSAVKQADAEGLDLDKAQQRLPVPQRLAFLRQAGVADAALAAYQRGNVVSFWRQLKESVAVAVERAIAEGGLEAGLSRYRELQARTDGTVFLDENELNLLGYRLLQQGKVTEALAVFQLNVEAFPGSWNVYDSLGEAYMTKGDRDRAVELYRRSLALNPDNANGRQMLERLGAEPEPAPQGASSAD